MLFCCRIFCFLFVLLGGFEIFTSQRTYVDGSGRFIVNGRSFFRGFSCLLFVWMHLFCVLFLYLHDPRFCGPPCHCGVVRLTVPSPLLPWLATSRPLVLLFLPPGWFGCGFWRLFVLPVRFPAACGHRLIMAASAPLSSPSPLLRCAPELGR